MAKSFPYRILLVDSDETLLSTSAAILGDAGYVVRTARDGFEALAALQGSVPEVLITELHMPGMSGFELLGVIRKRFPSIAVIAMSDQFTPLSMPGGLLVDRFMGKKDAPAMELLELVRQLTSEGPLRGQPAKAELAPAWVPRSGRYVVLTCPSCLRSSSVRSNGIAIGEQATETCVHCGADIAYYLDASVVADQKSLLDAAQQAIDSGRRTAESSRKMIESGRRMVDKAHERRKR